jgi:hypothetical protein
VALSRASLYDVLVKLPATLALGLLALALAATAQAFVVQFRTPSSNIGCLFSSEPGMGGPSLRCDIRSGLKPRPARRGCDLDLTGYELGTRGRATIVCAGDTAVNGRAKALRYGTRWAKEGFSCTSRRAGLRCKNRSGHGFFLSRVHSYRF